MMKFLRYLVLAVIALVIITLAFANREVVTLNLLPEDIETLVGMNLKIELPMFLIGFGGIAMGVVVGFIWEWMREHKYRAAAASHRRQVRELERKVTPAQDDVIALLESPSKVK